MARDKLYTFKYKKWGVPKEEVNTFPSMRDAMSYAIKDLPQRGYSEILPPVENDYLNQN